MRQIVSSERFAHNPAIIQVGDSYADLGATVTDTGPGQAGDANLGYQTFLKGTLVSNITINTSEPATDTIDYVVIDTDAHRHQHDSCHHRARTRSNNKRNFNSIVGGLLV
jgi:hypothetical protein